MKNLVLVLLLFTPILANGVYPKRGRSYNIAKVSTQLKDKNYTVEVGRRFHIGLQKNESVKYVITVPVLLSNTAIGIATDENVKKFRVVIYTQLNSDSKENAIFGKDIESSTFVQEISEKSYHYIVELTLLDSTKESGYSSVDVLIAHAPMPLKTAQDIKDFYYDHTGEVEYYSDPVRAKKAGNKKSDTSRIPCTNVEYGITCIR